MNMYRVKVVEVTYLVVEAECKEDAYDLADNIYYMHDDEFVRAHDESYVQINMHDIERVESNKE